MMKKGLLEDKTILEYTERMGNNWNLRDPLNLEMFYKVNDAIGLSNFIFD